jgi:hypothetical protein
VAAWLLAVFKHFVKDLLLLLLLLLLFHVSVLETNCHSIMVTVILHVPAKLIRDFSIFAASYGFLARAASFALKFLVGTRRADHATPLCPQNLALTLPTSCGRSV